jgi:uncharacterized protein
VLKVFLDANVLFAAAYTPKGRIAALFEFAELGACELLTSELALEEARRNLRAKRPDGLPHLEALMQQVVKVPDPPAALSGLYKHHLPPKDQPIMAAAVLADADWLVTGDEKHFGHLYGQTLGSSEVLRPAEALKRLAEVA